jgi:CheY-like chemotaxis protein
VPSCGAAPLGRGGVSARLPRLARGDKDIYPKKDAMVLPQILIVEDDAIVALDLSRRLTRWGYSVVRVTSGAAALAAVDTLRPGLVFMDVQLPGAMDGLQAAALWARRRVPIIYLTGEAPSALLNRVQTPPPVFTLSKPFSEAALQETLRQALAAWSDVPCP